jgi:hypothetical protein
MSQIIKIHQNKRTIAVISPAQQASPKNKSTFAVILPPTLTLIMFELPHYYETTPYTVGRNAFSSSCSIGYEEEPFI